MSTQRLSTAAAAALALAAVVSVFSPARAEELALQKSASAIEAKYNGLDMGILTLGPTMSAAEAKAALIKEYGDVLNVSEGTIGISYKSIPLESQVYTTRIAATKPGDEISVLFGTPATGNTVVNMTRRLTFEDARTAPEAGAVLAQLVSKYGNPSHNKPAVTGRASEMYRLTWVFDTKGPKPCPTSGCWAVYSSFQVDQLADEKRRLATGHAVEIMATAFTHSSDGNRVRTLEVTANYVANKVLTLEEAFQQFQKAGEELYRKSATPAAAPKL